MLGRLGPGWDNISDDWPLAVRIAEIANNRGDTGVPAQRPGLGSSFPAPITSVDDAYFDAASARDDALAAVTLRWPVGEHMRLKAIAYGHLGRGQALIWTPRAPSPNYGQAGAAGDDAPISIRGTEYDIDRRGVLASVAGDAGRHRISVGLWLEENRFDQARRFYALDLDAPGRSYDDFQKDAFLTEWDYRFVTRTRQAYVQDTWSVGEALTLSAGFKALSVESRAATRAGPRKAGSITASNPLLPQFGLRYRIGPDLEVFGDYGRGMRAFAAANTTGPFATTREAFDAIKSQLKPEISDSVEVGVRRTNDDVTLLAAVYAVRFRDRLFSTPVGQGILGNPLTIANVGSVTATGAEAAGVWRFAPGWSAYASYAYSRAAYDDDVFDGDGRLIGRTRDKQVVDAPAHIGKAHLDYRGEALFGRLGLTYLGERFFTFENDQRVPSHLTADLTLGWRFGDAGWRKGLEAQLNVTNLFDVRYVATLGGNDFPVRGDAQTLLAGPPRQVFFALRRSF
jgi:iron complex outermembrane receptor protein